MTCWATTRLEVHPPAFENDLQFDEALDLIPRLQGVARAHGRSLSVKFTNTLVVKNHKRFFSEERDVLVGRAAARDRAQPGKKISRASARTDSGFVLGRPRCQQRSAGGGDELRSGDQLHRSAAAGRLWPDDPIPGKPGRGDARAGREQHRGFRARVPRAGRGRGGRCECGRPAQHADPGGGSDGRSAVQMGAQ